jgi:AcrR family transcriptional regulator
MSSQKSNLVSTAREPQRDRGRQRVAALLQAAATIFAEKGFDGATMTEVAARATTAIGSLYQFFPNKEALADAVLARYGELMEAGLRRIEQKAAGLSPAGLADALFDLMADSCGDRAAAVVLLDARADAEIRRAAVRDFMRGRIADLLRTTAPRLSAPQAAAMAAALLQTLKGVAPLVSAHEAGESAAAPAELRDMLRVYLEHKLGR